MVLLQMTEIQGVRRNRVAANDHTPPPQLALFAFFVPLRIMSPPTAGTSSNEAGGQRILSTYYLLRLEDPFVNM